MIIWIRALIWILNACSLQCKFAICKNTASGQFKVKTKIIRWNIENKSYWRKTMAAGLRSRNCTWIAWVETCLHSIQLNVKETHALKFQVPPVNVWHRNENFQVCHAWLICQSDLSGTELSNRMLHMWFVNISCNLMCLIAWCDITG